jgi:hypothetical protein
VLPPLEGGFARYAYREAYFRTTRLDDASIIVVLVVFTNGRSCVSLESLTLGIGRGVLSQEGLPQEPLPESRD